MFVPAIRGELFRMRRNWRLLLLAYGLVPLCFLVFGSGIDLGLALNAGAEGRPVTADLMMRALAVAGNPLACLFFMVGAASAFADDYRWETWRLIAPRNGRARLILAKFLCFLLFVAVSLALAVLFDRLVGIVQALFGGTLGLPGPSDIGRFAVAYAAAVLELGVLGAVAGLAGVVTRSIVGGMLPAFLFSMFQALVLAYATPPPNGWQSLVIPAQAGYVLRLWVRPVSGVVPVEFGTALVAAASLLAWTAVCLGLIVLVLRSQDLSRE